MGNAPPRQAASTSEVYCTKIAMTFLETAVVAYSDMGQAPPFSPLGAGKGARLGGLPVTIKVPRPERNEDAGVGIDREGP